MLRSLRRAKENAMMTKKLSRHGNSLALVIDKPILELLELDAKSRVRITTDGRKLVVTPVELPDLDRKLEALFKNEGALEKILRELSPAK
jgi:antitoxin MazE